LTKKPKLTIAEHTRPKRALIRDHHEAHRNPKGRKKNKETGQPTPAKYHNWFTPLCWSAIKLAGEIAGSKMSATQIVNICRARQPEVFAGLTRETVKGWIDRTGDKAKWSEATLRRVEAGNVPGHTKGGPQGALVSESYMMNKA
jgi:hypothetical protein